MARATHDGGDPPRVEPSRAPRLGDLALDEHGAVYVEYVTLLVFVSLGAAAACLSLGLPLWKLYKYAQMILAAPFP